MGARFRVAALGCMTFSKGDDPLSGAVWAGTDPDCNLLVNARFIVG